MKVSAGKNGLLAREHQWVVGAGVELDIQHATQVVDRVRAGPVDLGGAAPRLRSPLRSTSPSPISNRPRWAEGARSPLAPSDPFSGTQAQTSRFSSSTSRSATFGLTPEVP